MADDVRFALLARPGPAREQLRKALVELGAILVAEGDPAELDPEAVGKLAPNLVIVSLEPAIEPALERFDALLSAHEVDVMYDDAETTKKLEGWDLNRWARHLASKLLGRDLLPPAPEDSPREVDLQPVPGAPPTPAQLMDNEKLEDYVAESPDLAEWVPTNPSLTGDAPVAEVETQAAARPREADEMPDFDLDLSSIESAMAGLPDADAPAERVIPPVATDDLSFDGDFSLELGNLEELIGAAPTPEPKLGVAKEEPLLADVQFDGGEINFSSFGHSDDTLETVPGMDDDVAALAAQLEEFEKSDTRETARDPDFSWAPNDDAAKAKELRATPPRTSKPMPEVPAPDEKSFEFGSLSLLDEDSLPVEPVKPVPVAAPSFDSLDFTLESLDETAVKVMEASSAKAPAASMPAAKPSFDVGSLSLETVDFDSGDSPRVGDAAAPGAVLVVAGMGGPDAVRQLLSHLPVTLPVPVLLYQHLEVGKHERLVDQLAKVSQLPVYLAVDGEPAKAGRVAVLPAGLGARRDGDGLSFTPGGLDALVRAMPARDSVLVVLSGADVGLVPAASKMRTDGGVAFTQAPDTCFDSAAAQALAREGAAALAPAQIATKVAERWPA
jgi:chemotaxis response regulator CheB